MARSSSPRILLTNDDGIDAPGIRLLEKVVAEFSDDVWVVAPDHERSGAGHSISMHNPIRLIERDERHFAVVGTPTDCVLMAHHQIMDGPAPDFVISGINNGANIAEDVSYSGTIAAAMEGTLLGIRSIAMSQLKTLGEATPWETAEAHAAAVLRKLLGDDAWPVGSFINVNFPDCAAEDVTGITVTSQGQRPPGSYSIDPRVDARHVPYFWVKIRYTEGDLAPGSDLEAASERRISVTPLKLDFTDHVWQAAIAQRFAD